MGKITLFTKEACPASVKVNGLLVERAEAANVTEISVSASPGWTDPLFLLARGDKSVPQVFFNSRHVGGWEEVERLEREGVLGERVRECLEGGSEEFPPPLWTPEPQELVQIIPEEVRGEWQESLEAMESSLSAAAGGRPISSLVVTLETPDSILVICTAGPAKDTFVVGAAVKKGPEDGQNKAYCQVALERNASLFVSDPTSVAGLEQNELMINFGYSYYAGAPWTVGRNRGTVVAMEKEAGVLKPEHMAIIEATRDKVMASLSQYISINSLN